MCTMYGDGNNLLVSRWTQRQGLVGMGRGGGCCWEGSSKRPRLNVRMWSPQNHRNTNQDRCRLGNYVHQPGQFLSMALYALQFVVSPMGYTLHSCWTSTGKHLKNRRGRKKVSRSETRWAPSSPSSVVWNRPIHLPLFERYATTASPVLS